MFLVFFLVWVCFNGQLTAEIAAFGVVIAGGMYLFLCKFLNYSPRCDLFALKKAPLLAAYVFLLAAEIVKANFAVFGMVYSARYELEPALVTFQADLRTPFARALLANAITLTPGTITVSLTENEYMVHCLDKEMAVGIASSSFVRLLQKIEA